MTRFGAAVLGLAIPLSVCGAACSGNVAPGSQEVRDQANFSDRVTTVSAEGSRDLPGSLGDLYDQSTLVVHAELVGQQGTRKIADLEMPVFEFRAIENLKGVGDNFRVVVGYEAYDYSTGVAVSVPIFTDNREYLLYLRPLQFVGKAPDTDFVTTAGPAGVFLRDRRESDDPFAAIDAEFPVGVSVTLASARIERDPLSIETPDPALLDRVVRDLSDICRSQRADRDLLRSTIVELIDSSNQNSMAKVRMEFAEMIAPSLAVVADLKPGTTLFVSLGSAAELLENAAETLRGIEAGVQQADFGFAQFASQIQTVGTVFGSWGITGCEDL